MKLRIIEEYRSNIADRLTLTDYINLEATRRQVEPSELWNQVQTTPLIIHEAQFTIFGSVRYRAVQRFNEASEGYDAVVNVQETSELTSLILWNYYSIRGLGVNFKDK